MEKAAKQTRVLIDQKKDVMEPCRKNTLDEQSGNENLPEWFHGLMSRREADEILKNQDIGKFLIRLSQRTFGYILSYKGKEHCRHFVINQLQSGDLVVAGDNCSHSSLPDLINYYQTSPIEPFGERLTQCCVKFSEYNTFDEIKPRAEQEYSQVKIPDIIPKNKRGTAQLSGQEKPPRASVQSSAPPLPERSGNQFDMQENEEDTYATPKKFPMDPSVSSLVAANRHQEEMAKDSIYSNSNKMGVIYSLAKEAQINQHNIKKTSEPQVVYSEVRLDNSLPSALGHLQSKSGNQREVRKMSLEAGSPRGPNVKEISQYKVMEMKFASSLQCTNIQTFSNEASRSPLLGERVEMPGGSFLHPVAVSQSDFNNTYEQIPFSGIRHMEDQISNISHSCTTTYDHITTRTSKEVVMENLYEKMPIQNTLQDDTYETVTRNVTKPTVKKNVVNKNEKQKRFFFADRKK